MEVSRSIARFWTRRAAITAVIDLLILAIRIVVCLVHGTSCSTSANPYPSCITTSPLSDAPTASPGTPLRILILTTSYLRGNDALREKRLSACLIEHFLNAH